MFTEFINSLSEFHIVSLHATTDPRFWIPATGAVVVLPAEKAGDCYSCYSFLGVEIIMILVSSPALMKSFPASGRLIEWFRLGTAFVAWALHHIHYKFVLVACS